MNITQHSHADMLRSTQQESSEKDAAFFVAAFYDQLLPGEF